MAAQKQIHSLVVDTGPLIKNTISISTIIQSAEHIYTTSAVLSEIRDPATRSRVETTLLPFLTLRNPTSASYEHVAQFSKKTGDFSVLSRQDLGILALAYEIDQERKKQAEEEKTKGEQKTPAADEQTADVLSSLVVEEEKTVLEAPGATIDSQNGPEQSESDTHGRSQYRIPPPEAFAATTPSESPAVTADTSTDVEPVEDGISKLQLSSEETSQPSDEAQDAQVSSEEDDDGGEWITPSNLKKHQAKDSGVSLSERGAVQLSCATMTTDYAMQNVLLQLKLSLISPSMQRIKNLRTHIMRCHACFQTTKDMDKQFCPRCGGATLRRVTCSTNARGEFKIHLSSKFQHNNRGNRYSVPKPVAGTASGKHTKGGGKGGWGRDLVLAEDQKEYVRAIDEGKRAKTKDLMDEDYLPRILTGDRGRAGGRPKVGAGKNVNSRKRY
ncbi:20S-pre-rRNA D-site endonuclease NOB1 [Lophiostoma macrostomum CBS 122681]|uniref:20S-pre-rRNA D-site endonuclease NOB1 n=1 Tax=Lophiostoma macrostomum CBS 122681 TaxID=1314788 RepID=A0A6A6SJA1_9PLEO|nr:20S-pre-rRNA D-site endonuclease NOB1 [Lophiostoma macrostomum CBS 122681]